MPGRNVAVVRQALDAWNKRSASAADEDLLRLAHEDVHLDFTARVLNPATYTGTDGLRRFTSEVDELWAAFRMEPEELSEAGDQVVAVVRAVGRGRESGVEVDGHVAMVFTLRDGRITALRVDPDVDAARRLVRL